MNQTDIVQGALFWAERGWRVHPVNGKIPRVHAWNTEATTDPDAIRAWWNQWPHSNVGGVPPAGSVVVDIDEGAPELDWPETLEMRTGSGGRHLVYADPQGSVKQTQGGIWSRIDIREPDKGFVVLPPSLHVHTGLPYELLHDRDLAIFPYHLLPAEHDKRKPGTAVRDGRGGETLARLLTSPSDPEFGDDRMVRIAGHLARALKAETDWWATLSWINEGLDEPLDPKAMAKKRGIWYKEHEKPEYNTDEDRGWLFEAGDRGYSSLVESGSGKLEAMAWSDFRVSARGVMYDQEGRIDAWLIDLHLADGSTMAGVRLPSTVLASTASLRRWLMAYGCTLHTTAKDPRTQAGERLMKLMQSQKPERVAVTDHFGWNASSAVFLTPAGQITAEGAGPFCSVYPKPAVETQNKARYGLCPPDEAVGVLREVLSFQDELATSLMGSWLVMLLLRGQWQGLMPGLLVEAYSESGKTTFLTMLCALAGQPQGGGTRTLAVSRDWLTANASGILLLDDVELDHGMQQLVRNAVTGGSAAKKAGDGWSRTDEYPLRGGVILSGEGMDFAKQKANRDRFIRVELGKATDRRSTRDPERAQWHDVQALLAQYGGDLSAVAGGLVQAVLGRAALVSELPRLLAESGRSAQGAAVVRTGARILDDLLGGGHAERVDTWAATRATDDSTASVVTLELIPTSWRRSHQPDSAGPPVFRDEHGAWWVNATKLYDAFKPELRFDERMKSLTSVRSIIAELNAIGAEKGKTLRYGPDNAKYAQYRKLPDRYNDMLLELSIGGTSG